MIEIIIIMWFIIGIFNYGTTFAYYQREYPLVAKKNRKEDMWFATMIAVMGPVGLIITIFAKRFKGFKHGFKFW